MKDVLKKERFFVLIIVLTILLNFYAGSIYTDRYKQTLFQDTESILTAAEPEMAEEELKGKIFRSPVKYYILFILDGLFILTLLFMFSKGLVFYGRFTVKSLILRPRKDSENTSGPDPGIKPLGLLPSIRAVVMIFFFWSILGVFQILIYPVFATNWGVLGFLVSMGFQTCGILSILYYVYNNKPIFLNLRDFKKQLKKTGLIYARIIPVFILAVIVTLFIFQEFNLKSQPQEITNILVETQNPLVLILLSLSIIVFAPIFEELLFRGILFRAFRNKFSFVFSAVLSGIIFSLAHSNYFSFLPIFTLGFVFAYIYEKTKNLKIPILLHSLHNLFAFSLILLVKAHY
jgi:membrane protease YdiL (CAAX protease family)